jgi:hypothetical protein
MDRKSLWVSRAKRFGLPLLWAVVAGVIYHRARDIEWDRAWEALHDYSGKTIATAFALATAAHMVSTCYDLFGRRYVGHSLSRRLTVPICFVGYTFTLNLGSIVGGVGFRYRLYTRFGLETGQIAQIIALSVLTNWSGYTLMLGVLLLVHPPGFLPLPPSVLHLLGVALLMVAAGYLTICALGKPHDLRIQGVRLKPPPLPFAVTQLLWSSANWLLIIAVIHTLMPGEIPYGAVMMALLASSIAGVIAVVPGGIGVLEATFLAVLGKQVPPAQLIAALLAYRAAYYLTPFLAALIVYAGLELRARGDDSIRGTA